MNNYEHVKYVYQMMTDYAKQHISKEFTTFPIWCWHTIDGAIPNDGIRIELDVPDNLVLLSDYYTWGGDVIPQADDYFNYYNKSQESKTEIDNLFNICVNPDYFQDDIQAIIPYVKLDWVSNMYAVELMEIEDNSFKF